MSATICSVSGSGLNQDGVQATTLGGSKPLHRFLRGQPKIIGNIMLVMGTSLLVTTVALMRDFNYMNLWPHIPPNLILELQFIACGILYILTEHNPTKKTVTISLALSIVSLVGVAWTVIVNLPLVAHAHGFWDHESLDNMITALVAVQLFYTMVGAVIVIVMSCLAGAALRSTKTQAVIVMTAASTETPAGN